MKPRVYSALLLAIACCSQVRAAAADTAGDYTSMSLEALMQVEVTTVSKVPQRASAAAAAVFVLTREDIRRSGVTTIPDALRLVPGVDVARINANAWAVTVRGFNSRFANKLLVMIDGRSIFTPLFSGVFWDDGDIILDDIEHIEVVRGPGATLWGANAVNGVINIITRHSKDTQGKFVQLSTGTSLHGEVVARQGGKIGENATYNIYMKYDNREGSDLSAGQNAHDAWETGLIGFRTDWTLTHADALLLEGNLNTVNSGETLNVPILTPPYVSRRTSDLDREGGYLMGQWTHTYDEHSAFSLQSYFDHRSMNISQGKQSQDTFDIHAQQSFRLGNRNDVLLGGGYRNVSDTIESNDLAVILPASQTVETFSGFAQDTIHVVKGKLDLVLGSKFESNTYTGFDAEPSIRLMITPDDRQTIWAAISRAVRTPSRAEEGAHLNAMVIPPHTPGLNPTALPVLLRFTGDSSIDSENLTAYELGYRFNWHDKASIDIATFYNVYGKLRDSVFNPTFIETSPLPVHVVEPVSVDASTNAKTYGFEVVGNWQALEHWRLQATYSYLGVDVHQPVGPQYAPGSLAGGDPRNQATLRSLLDIGHNVNVDAVVRYVGSLPKFSIGAYTTADIRVAWRPMDKLELALTGRNLFDAPRFEFGTDPTFPTLPSKVESSFLATATITF